MAVTPSDRLIVARKLGRTLLQLSELLEKYRLLEALHKGVPGRTLERRDAIRQVVDRFPAAMREWDEVPFAELVQRRKQVEGVLDTLCAGVTVASLEAVDLREHAWMRIGAEIHERLRDTLRIKRWLAGREVTDALATDAEQLQGVTRARLEEIAAPPDGHVAELVFREVADLLALPVAEVKAALFVLSDRR